MTAMVKEAEALIARLNATGWRGQIVGLSQEDRNLLCRALALLIAVNSSQQGEGRP